MLAALMAALHALATTNCPGHQGVYIPNIDDQSNWSFHPGPTATQQQIDDTNQAIRTLDLTPYQDEINLFKGVSQ